MCSQIPGTCPEPITGDVFVRLACSAAGQPYRIQVVPNWMLRLLGRFMRVIRENMEMMYQFECDYRFDSSQIRSAFGRGDAA